MLLRVNIVIKMHLTTVKYNYNKKKVLMNTKIVRILQYYRNTPFSVIVTLHIHNRIPKHFIKMHINALYSWMRVTCLRLHRLINNEFDWN